LRQNACRHSGVRDAPGRDGSDAVSLGEIAVKGYERPMPVWQLG
jgi:adenylate cyclase